MKNNYEPIFKVSILLLIFLFIFYEPAFAKKVIGYIPPPYYIRFLISLFTLAPIGFIIGGVCYFVLRYFDYENCIKNKKMYLLILIGLILMASFTGSLDALNDECWNPAMIGSVSLSLIVPVASLILHRRLKLLHRMMISFALIIPSLLIFELITYSYQIYSYFELGWPTAW